MEGGMEESDLYEALPPQATVGTYMLAGAMAGMGEHCIMYPFDCVKTRMQSLVPDPKANYKNVPDALIKIFHHEGLKNTVRGINALVIGAGPAHALYFACYEKLKKVLSGGTHGNHIANGTAGCVATILHDSVMNPADVHSRDLSSIMLYPKQCNIEQSYKEEGVRAFYRSFTTQLTMNIPFQAVHFMTYEILQNSLNPDRNYDPVTHGLSGAGAGACAAIVTMPLDVCKTILNTQEHCARTSMSAVNGMKEAFKLVYEFQGLKGYFRGVQARVLYQMPSTAISWSVYELFKNLLIQRKQHEDGKYLSISGMSVQAVSSTKS